MNNPAYHLALLMAAFVDLALPLSSLSCEWQGKSRAAPDVIDIDASITTQSGSTFPCSVKDYYLVEPSFDLYCANGSKIYIGRSPMCGGSMFPACDYSIVTDRKGQHFKMSEQLSPGWDRLECANGVVSSVMNYDLKQDAFRFEARIVIRVKEAKRLCHLDSRTDCLLWSEHLSNSAIDLTRHHRFTSP
jgi:hypothetical protein